jgi:hypothetical protein
MWNCLPIMIKYFIPIYWLIQSFPVDLSCHFSFSSPISPSLPPPPPLSLSQSLSGHVSGHCTCQASALPLSYIPNTCFLETGSHYAAQSGLELKILLPQPLLVRELSVCILPYPLALLVFNFTSLSLWRIAGGRRGFGDVDCAFYVRAGHRWSISAIGKHRMQQPGDSSEDSYFNQTISSLWITRQTETETECTECIPHHQVFF